ncbi:MAG: phosphate acyltransferase [Zetaproteobacteria bacterium CG2_30_46_52]|nr:MAG: phosphate acyltransferase [Zetaproteobacteria bacterium CG2_30_46_52]
MPSANTTAIKPLPRILLDGHGGDGAPDVVLDALQQTLASPLPKAKFGVCGLVEIIEPALKARGLDGLVEIVPATEVIDMCDAPALAVRKKKQSSMHVSARAVRDGDWDAFVSAGNTGALMAVSKLILKTLPGIDRPAIASHIPAVDGGTFFLDIGANAECSSENLVQFAVMGSCYLQAAEGMKSPRVGLLNIGTEEGKGTDVIKMAAARLKDSELNYIGFVEGTDLFSDSVDVVVCDGFIGNVSLKTMEGLAKFMLSTIKQELTSSVVAKTGALLAKGALKRVKNNMNPSEHNGAPLLGLNGIVVKSHGGADAYAYACAIQVARREVEANLIERTIQSMNVLAEANT